VTLDAASNVYLADTGNNRILKLAADAASPITLPLGELREPVRVAVDADGELYVSDSGNNRILKLAAHAASPVVMPLDELSDPGGVAVDAAGAVYTRLRCPTGISGRRWYGEFHPAKCVVKVDMCAAVAQ
jgi:serine/threonine-protein kinase